MDKKEFSAFVRTNIDRIKYKVLNSVEEEIVEEILNEEDFGKGTVRHTDLLEDVNIEIDGVNVFVTGTMESSWDYGNIISHDYYEPNELWCDFIEGTIEDVYVVSEDGEYEVFFNIIEL